MRRSAIRQIRNRRADGWRACFAPHSGESAERWSAWLSHFRPRLVAHHECAILRDQWAVATRSDDRIERDREARTERDAHPARRQLIDQIALVGESALRN